MNGKMKYSNTSIETFEQCRLKFKFHYIDKIGKKIKSIDAFLGSRVHETMEKLYNDLKNGKMDSLEELLSFYDNAWDMNYSDKITNPKKEYTPGDFKNVGRKCITDYYNSHFPFDDMNVIAVENNDVLILPGGYEYFVRIDKFACKGDTFFVCDYKTGTQLKSQQEADEDRQLALYSVWARQKYNTDKVKLMWHMLRFDRDVVSERTEEQLKDLMNKTSEIIREIESCNDWSTNKNALCNYCEFQYCCPEFGHVIKIEEEIEKHTYTEDEGAKLVDEYVKLDEKRSKIKEELEPIEDEMAEIKNKIADYAKQFGFKAVAGLDKQANVKWEKKAKISDENLEKAIEEIIKSGKLSDYQKFDKQKAEKDIASGKLPELAVFAEQNESLKVTFSNKK